MKILVTGADGYLGQGIVKKLLDKGATVVASVYDKAQNVSLDSRAIVKRCDIFEIEKPFEYFEEPDVLLHLAWRDGFVHFSDAHLNDLPKHVKFVSDFAISPVHTISVMGSMHEIGFFEGSIDEDTPCHPESFYGIAKNALRDATRIICKRNNKNFQWLRGYYIVGNTPRGSSIFSKIAAAAEAGQKKFPFTMGLNQFDFLDYDDFCLQVSSAVLQDRINGIINICSGYPEKLAERVERFIKENGYNVVLEYGAFPDRPYDSKAVWGNSQKIQSILSAE